EANAHSPNSGSATPSTRTTCRSRLRTRAWRRQGSSASLARPGHLAPSWDGCSDERIERCVRIGSCSGWPMRTISYGWCTLVDMSSQHPAHSSQRAPDHGPAADRLDKAEAAVQWIQTLE